MNRKSRLRDASLQRKEKKATTKRVQLAMAERPCGPCVACCTTMGVSELGKQPGVVCWHLGTSEHVGCGIYGTRPNSCRTFNCLWKKGLGSTDERPDRTGIIFDVSIPPIQALIAREITFGAFEQHSDMFDRLGKEGQLVILLRDEKMVRMIGPPDKVTATMALIPKKDIL
jgi:hypothetical protein